MQNAGALSAVLSLAEWVHSGMIHMTLLDLLETQQHFPGLVSDIDRCIWQVMLIKQQLDTEND